jgi:hypothetical protein
VFEALLRDKAEVPSLLEIACEDGLVEAVTSLRSVFPSCDLDSLNKKGMPPLLVACKHGHTELVKLLLTLGCDVGVCEENRKRNCMHLAVIGRHEALVRYLLEVADEEILNV